MDVYNKVTFINRILDQSEGINEWMFITSLHSLTEYRINQRDQSEGIDEWMFKTSLHSLTEYQINQRESMTGCL